MTMSFLERTGVVKTARRERESILLARAVIRGEPIKTNDGKRLLELAKLNKVFARAGSLLGVSPVLLDESKADLAEALALYDLMRGEFDRAGISFVVIKSFDSLPDMGHDVDLLIPSGSELEKAKTLLLNKYRVIPQPLTPCDKLLGKFSCFVRGYKHDFELYPTISQLGEQHVDPDAILRNRKLETINNKEIWVTSPKDRVLIRVIHAMFRHNFLKLSDIVDFLQLSEHCTIQEILDAVDQARIPDAFMFYLECITRFLKACQAETPFLVELKTTAEKRFGKDRLGFLRKDKLVLPYRIPVLAIFLLFLLKGSRATSHGMWRTGMLCFATPIILILDFVNNALGNRLFAGRIW